MARLYPFRAVRPAAGVAARVAAPPYDVLTTDEARELAHGNPQSFLRVTRAELELPPDTPPYSEAVYARARANFEALRTGGTLLHDAETAVYVYRLRMGDHEQTGVAGCFSIDEYEQGIIKKHERTRQDKEDDRTRHIGTVRAQTGPVFLTYRAAAAIDSRVDATAMREPLYDFVAVDGVRHTLWQAPSADARALIAAFADVPALYIADGHHRAASAARNRAAEQERAAPSADANLFLGVAFADRQVRILPYNRVVKDLVGQSPAEFRAAITRLAPRLELQPGGPVPARAGEVAMYLDGGWYRLAFRAIETGDPVRGLDASLLQDRVLGPLLGITDPRADRRIDFVGGIRGPEELVRRVDTGAAAVAFAMHPLSVDDLMRVSDAGAVLPPKSTWFEPKLRDGLLVHVF
jgi:uncharacterized protein (DUF1015 family)